MPGSWTQEPERGSNWALRSLFFVLNVLGYHVVRCFLIPIVFYFVVTGKRSRSASRKYLTKLHAFTNKTPLPTFRQVYLHHFAFAIALLERVLLWQGKMKGFKFSGEGRDLLETPRKTGCILLGAHLGSFDALRILASNMNCRVNVVMYRAHAAQINKFLQDLNPETNLRVIELSETDTEGVLKLKTSLDNGEHVAILADRQGPASKQRIQLIPFLGSRVAFPESPWLLASIFRCPVIFVAAVQTGTRSYKIYVEKIAEKINRDAESLQEHIFSYVQKLEKLCIDHPFQWFNFYDFWNENDSGRGAADSEPKN